jgi:hypothetical protein
MLMRGKVLICYRHRRGWYMDCRGPQLILPSVIFLYDSSTVFSDVAN